MFGVNRSDHGTSGIGSPESTDAERRLNNVLRVGMIHAVDYRRAVARVAMQEGEIITDWLPWLTARAGGDLFWWAPEPGEVVLVGSLSGELHNGFIWPAAFSNGNQPAARGSVCRATFADGTTVEYDRKAHVLRVAVFSGEVEEPEEVDAEESDAAEGPTPDDPTVTGGTIALGAAEDILGIAGRDSRLQAERDIASRADRDHAISVGRNLAIHVQGNFSMVVEGESDTSIGIIGNADFRLATTGRVEVQGSSGVFINGGSIYLNSGTLGGG